MGTALYDLYLREGGSCENKALKVCEPLLYARELPPSSFLRLCLAAGGTPAAYPWDKQTREIPSSLSSATTEQFCAYLPNHKLPRRKVSVSSPRNRSSKRSFVTGRLGTLPFTVTRWESSAHPAPQSSSTWMPAAARPVPALPDAPEPRRRTGGGDAQLQR